MLVLSRKRSEIVRIGNDTQITIVDVRGDKVRLGIEAPREVAVWRSELMSPEEFRSRRITHERLTELGFVPDKSAFSLTIPSVDLPEHPSQLRLVPNVCESDEEWIIELWNHATDHDVCSRVAFPRCLCSQRELDLLLSLLLPRRESA